MSEQVPNQPPQSSPDPETPPNVRNILSGAKIPTRDESAANAMLSSLEMKRLEDDRKKEQSTVSRLFRGFIWAVGAAFISVCFFRVLHFILPTAEHCLPVFGFNIQQWMSKDQVQEIDKVLFSGSVGGAIGNYMKGKFNGQ